MSRIILCCSGQNRQLDVDIRLMFIVITLVSENCKHRKLDSLKRRKDEWRIDIGKYAHVNYC